MKTWLLLLLLVVVVCTGSEAYDNPMIDITHLLEEGMAIFGFNKTALTLVVENEGHRIVTGVIGNLGTHFGTHLDSPSHMRALRSLGLDTSRLNLKTLVGPVLVVSVPADKNITAEVLSSLQLPNGLGRVIFKTVNTDRRLMERKAFVSDYTALTIDGAKWLVENTQIKFVGVDYMSVSTYESIVPVHVTLMNGTGIIPVECLKLDEVRPGRYNVYCLPLKLKADGVPVRCILTKKR